MTSTNLQQYDRIAELEAENQLLREQLANAHTALKGSDDWNWVHETHFPRSITPLGLEFLKMLFKSYPSIVAKEMLYIGTYGHRVHAEWPDEKVIDVRICHLRKALPPFSIATHWGRGYSLTKIGKDWIDIQMARSRKKHGQS